MTQWQLLVPTQIPEWFLETVKLYAPDLDGSFIAQLLWQRGIRDPERVAGFLSPEAYQPLSPFTFGQEMKLAVKRLVKAIEFKEKVAIWGDFDADGITATSVLWEGLGEFFPQHDRLVYYIPNRLRESHGLNCEGIDRLAQSGIKLIVTCDTGSTNEAEINYANGSGIDIIITDHHTLPVERPPAIAIINPRYFADTHPLFYLSGVAVAYKLVEAMYQTLPDFPKQPLENLLDLVAIGLIADLVELKGDCRYLAQKGIKQLEKQASETTATRPGITRLLELCRRNGDRPTDISFGLGPRINAVSRIQGDAGFCVELLTSRDRQRCNELAEQTELANTRRKSLQKDTLSQVKKKLAQIDLSTTSVIVLEDPQWETGVLGLVAGQIAQEYGRPTILLSSAQENYLARGSARSIANIDLYQLVSSQAHLLHRFGGHPFAAGLSLPVENIALFREGIDRNLRQQIGDLNLMQPTIKADLTVKASQLGKNLFRELKLLEPCGMGNPVPKLLIQNCWFERVWHNSIEDLKGKKVQYIKTTFQICDNSTIEGFPGVWWEHYKDELPQDRRCDAIVELDFNAFKKNYEVRLIAVRSCLNEFQFSSNLGQNELILDWRGKQQDEIDEATSKVMCLDRCPSSWHEIQLRYKRAIALEEKLALAYPPPPQRSPQEIWQQLIGIAKYLSRTDKIASKEQIKDKLELSDRALKLGLAALDAVGFANKGTFDSIQLSLSSDISALAESNILSFLEAVAEEQFQRQYFYKVPLTTVRGIVSFSETSNK
jgi:single-stranded-DNA-specific exonuclease